ncbi:hypothetical protein GQ43DRAFT_211841 [Delitschia confertaspora ATCC 74209]|uniref:Uncharacterized protein n=1 Tax=Delitschia confertaspora ATCC 74209 TaxID=1513339 RepID=A0A9P4JRX1_9PLEO|nr:hypothetical protein GQ43DRAFT_211841 [Delitschia confertaspora ATCC 74209]
MTISSLLRTRRRFITSRLCYILESSIYFSTSCITSTIYSFWLYRLHSPLLLELLTALGSCIYTRASAPAICSPECNHIYWTILSCCTLTLFLSPNSP